MITDFKQGATIEPGPYRGKVADAAGLLLTNALAGTGHFVLVVLGEKGPPAFTTNLQEPGHVAAVLTEAARAAMEELT